MMNMMLVFSLFVIFLLSLQVKAQVMTDCDPYHHCLTCTGVMYNCTTCPKGYFLEEFAHHLTCTRCPRNCLDCENSLLCSACKIKNHYGKDCQSVCSKGCLNETCSQSSGTCLCKDNYEGGRCDYCAKGKHGYDSNCTMDCPANCITCFSDKTCTKCTDGYYGDDCKPKCPANCVSCFSGRTCDKCIDGFWGDTCQQKCSKGCLAGICLKKSGVCQDKQCRSGFAGEKCDRCLNCHRDDGTQLGKDSSASTIHLQLCLTVLVLLVCCLDVTEYFLQKFLQANSVDPDETPHYWVYTVCKGLFC